ncbi:DUF4259 domain-containing protein [Kitasatospora sp. NPDC054768]
MRPRRQPRPVRCEPGPGHRIHRVEHRRQPEPAVHRLAHPRTPPADHHSPTFRPTADRRPGVHRGTRGALPVLATDLRPLAVEALDRVVAGGSELAELWDEAPDGTKWRQAVRRPRAVLAPDPEPQDALFDL